MLTYVNKITSMINILVHFFQNLKKQDTYGNVDLQTAEDIRILKRHVDELNELFVSGQAAEDAAGGRMC